MAPTEFPEIFKGSWYLKMSLSIPSYVSDEKSLWLLILEIRIITLT